MEFPQVDLPVDMIAWTEVTEDILNYLYKQSCRLKACIFALCIEGSITVSINLMDTEIKQRGFHYPASRNHHTVLRTKEKVCLGFVGFSSHCLNGVNLIQSTLSSFSNILEYPVLAVNPTVASYFKDYFALWAHHDRSLSSRYKMAQSTLNMLLSGIDRMYCHRPQMQKGIRAGRGNMPRTGAARHRKLYPRTPRAILCRQTGHLPATPQHHRGAGDRQKCIGHHRPRRHRRRESQAEINQHDHSGDCLFLELPQCFFLWKILQEAHGHGVRWSIGTAENTAVRTWNSDEGCSKPRIHRKEPWQHLPAQDSAGCHRRDEITPAATKIPTVL